MCEIIFIPCYNSFPPQLVPEAHQTCQWHFFCRDIQLFYIFSTIMNRYIGSFSISQVIGSSADQNCYCCKIQLIIMSYCSKLSKLYSLKVIILFNLTKIFTKIPIWVTTLELVTTLLGWCLFFSIFNIRNIEEKPCNL